MRRKKSLAARQAKTIAKDAHNLDEDVKDLHGRVHLTHKSAEQFHKNTQRGQKKVEANSINHEKATSLTEAGLKESAEQQLAELAMGGRRAVKKSA